MRLTSGGGRLGPVGLHDGLLLRILLDGPVVEGEWKAMRGGFWSLSQSGSGAHLRHSQSRITSSRISVGGGRIVPPSLSCGSSSWESGRGNREAGRKKRGSSVGELKVRRMEEEEKSGDPESGELEKRQERPDEMDGILASLSVDQGSNVQIFLCWRGIIMEPQRRPAFI
jgi:hypothetical protein